MSGLTRDELEQEVERLRFAIRHHRLTTQCCEECATGAMLDVLDGKAVDDPDSYRDATLWCSGLSKPERVKLAAQAAPS